MKIPQIKTPSLILNDNVQCQIQLYNGEIDIDGKQTVVFSKKFNCYYEMKNTIVLNSQSVETKASGLIKVNGNIGSDKYDYAGGVITIKGQNINKKSKIITVEKMPNIYDCNIIDYTIIYIE